MTYGNRFVSDHLDMEGHEAVLVEARRSRKSAAIHEPAVVSVLEADEKQMWMAAGPTLLLGAAESARTEIPIPRRLVRIEVEVPDGLPPADIEVRLTRLRRSSGRAP